MTGLWAVLLVPFFVANLMYFPFITGKNFAFRIIVEIIFALWVYLAFVDAKYRPKFSWISISVGIFVFIMLIADIFAVNPLKALWSNYERMDGWITLIHLLMYMIVFGSVMKTEQNWKWFFRSSLIASTVMIGYVLKEWLMDGSLRVSVQLGNPIYVAVYYLFNFFFALILLNKDVIEKSVDTPKPVKSIFTNWLTYVYLASAFISAFGIWRTSTRGVILGLLGGLVVTSIAIAIFEKKNKLIKNSAIGGLVVIAVLVGGFFAIKNTQFVKNNVTLERLAEISWTNVAGQGQARQYVWPMALKGAMEKPILGWGQDGFNYVFNKYYDPRMYNQEQWFDRAHNTPLDVLVAGGALGLIAYLFIFISALVVLWKRRNNLGTTDAALLLGLLAAYFAQNLFVFDNLISYVFFYTVLAYLYSKDVENKEEKKNDARMSADMANYVVLPIILLALGTSLWFCNVKPIYANLNLINAMRAVSQSPKDALGYFKSSIDGSVLGKMEAREQLLNVAPNLAMTATLDATVKQDFIQYTYAQMMEQLNQTPNDARYQFFTGVLLDNLGQYQMALPYLQKSVELSPNKLTMIFELSKCYAYLGQNDLSLSWAKKAYDLVPEFDEGRMNYISALIVNGNEFAAKQLMGTSTPTDSVLRAYLVRASSFLKKGDKASAISEVNKAIKLSPSFKTQGEQIIKGINDGTIKA